MIADQLLTLLAAEGHNVYFGEEVTELEHALQTAFLAESSGAGEEQVVAALLHDIGHLLHRLPEDIADRGFDGRHEEAGAVLLAVHFGPAVAEPVRLHVAAKRYLCGADAGYAAGLSAASRRSLELQGGPFTVEEKRAFEENPWCPRALALRRWDDAAKIPGRAVPGLDHYRPHLRMVLNQGGME